MDYYLYTVELPYSEIQISYRDINSKEQLILAKSNILLPLVDENLVEYSRILKKTILNCVENKNDFLKLNLIDYILFITKLRIISIGDTIELNFESLNSTESTTTIKIDLNMFMKSLYEASLEALKDNIILYKDLEVVLDWPNIQSEERFLSFNKTNSHIYILDTIYEYIKEIKIKNSNIILNGFETKQKEQLYESLPLSLKNKIQEKVFGAIKKLSEVNIFGIKRMDYINFSFYNKTHQYITRMLFSNDLRSIYQEYYILASKNINPEYVDKLSVPDRRVFCSFIQEENERKAEAQNQGYINSENSRDLASLMDEFGE